jgi:hypothetical protein
MSPESGVHSAESDNEGISRRPILEGARGSESGGGSGENRDSIEALTRTETRRLEEGLAHLMLGALRRNARADWRDSLLPGGVRLLAHEVQLSKASAVTGVGMSELESTGAVPADEGSHERGSPQPTGILERLLLIIELANIRLGRRVLLRAAGMRLAEQRRLKEVGV